MYWNYLSCQNCAHIFTNPIFIEHTFEGAFEPNFECLCIAGESTWSSRQKRIDWDGSSICFTDRFRSFQSAIAGRLPPTHSDRCTWALRCKLLKSWKYMWQYCLDWTIPNSGDVSLGTRFCMTVQPALKQTSSWQISSQRGLLRWNSWQLLPSCVSEPDLKDSCPKSSGKSSRGKLRLPGSHAKGILPSALAILAAKLDFVGMVCKWKQLYSTYVYGI